LGWVAIDLSRTEVREGAAPVHSYIIVDEGTKTRTILYTLDGVVGAPPAGPPERVVRGSRVVFVDHWGVEGMIRAATIARDAGIPVVGDLERESEPRFRELLSLVDHLIVSWDFARRLTGEARPEQAVLALFEERRNTVVVTVGAGGCYYATSAARRQVRHVPACSVDVVDTTGCGDVFHGAYAASLARGEPVEHRVAFATAAAALKATASGGQAGIPSRADVQALLRQRGGASLL
jgi:sugar/nucleoside kinase (ribokinase family)